MSKMLLDEYPLLVGPRLATTIGLNEAIVLQQLHYWLLDSKKEHKGHVWTYNTYEEWQKQMPWWSERTIRRALDSLREVGLVIVDRFNKVGYDKTNWYTIDYDRLDKMTSGSGQNDQADKDKVATPIPKTSSETTLETTTVAVPLSVAEPLVLDLEEEWSMVQDHGVKKREATAHCSCGATVTQADAECPDCGRIVVWKNSSVWKKKYGPVNRWLEDQSWKKPADPIGVEIFHRLKLKEFSRKDDARQWAYTVKNIPEQYIRFAIDHVLDKKQERGYGALRHIMNLARYKRDSEPEFEYRQVAAEPELEKEEIKGVIEL